MSSNRPASMTTSSSTVRPSSPSRSTTPPAAWIFVAPSVASTGCSSVLPFVPSTIEWNRVSSGMPLPTSASANAGMLVVPSTSMRSSTPLNAPDEFRIPAIPSKTPRSAFSKRYDAASGVWDGSSACQGPNVPSVWMRPGGVGLVRFARNGHGWSAPTSFMSSCAISNTRGALPGFLRRIRSTARSDCRLRTMSGDFSSSLSSASARLAGVIGLVVVQAHAAGWDVDLQALQTDVAHRDRIAEESHEAGFARE